MKFITAGAEDPDTIVSIAFVRLSDGRVIDFSGLDDQDANRAIPDATSQASTLVIGTVH